MVKLVYQSEFAGGHLIADNEQSEKRIAEERRTANAVGAPLFAFENIGEGLYRLHLNAPEASGFSDATINRFFINTAAVVRGDTARFEQKLAVLMQCCREGLLPFDVDESVDYIASLKAAGYPPVSHSEAYREAYHPAYRVVSAQYRDFAEVFRRIDALKACVQPLVIAIDGGSASGKTTLAGIIADVYDAAVLHMDHFFLPPERKTPQRLLEPGGNVDYERFDREVMAGLRSGGDFSYRVYDCKTGTLGAPVDVHPVPVNIVEGAYSMHPRWTQRYDLSIFLDIDAAEQSRRILRRNGETMLKRFTEEWIPLESRYFDALDIKRQSGLVYKVPFQETE